MLCNFLPPLISVIKKGELYDRHKKNVFYVKEMCLEFALYSTVPIGHVC